MVRILTVALLLSATAMSLAPVISNWWENHLTAEQAVSDAADILADPDREGRMQASHEHNAQLGQVSGVVDPWKSTHEQDRAAQGGHEYRLLAGSPMAVLDVPRIGLHMSVRPGVDKATLRKGAGHMPGTSLPVGGPGTHAVLVGHSDMRNRVYFDRVKELTEGDRFTVTSSAGTLTYVVDQSVEVEPSDLTHIQPIGGEDYVTLLTCIELVNGHHQRRLLVRGHREVPTAPVPQDSASANNALMLPAEVEYRALPFGWQPWMLGHLAVAGLSVVVLVFAVVGWIKDDREDRH